MDLEELSREESLAFFINLYNMMAIHAILSWGPPTKAMERRKFFGDFKYVIGGFPYSLSAIHNGILRSNQRPPYSLTKPFAPRDKRSKVTTVFLHHFVFSSHLITKGQKCLCPIFLLLQATSRYSLYLLFHYWFEGSNAELETSFSCVPN